MRLESGMQIADVVLDRQLGAGGQGEVWLATTADGAQVAAKILKATSPDQVLRAMREARLQAAVDAPNVVKILDFRLVDDVPVILSEWVHGISLQQLLRQRRPSVDQMDRLANQLFDGVEAAHAHGLVHRDLKPANVLIASTHGGWVAKITDFGIAIESAPFRPGDSLSGHGEMVGTPGFMAPEQYLESDPVDQRADVFGLGAVLYWLVTGRRAFSGAHRVEVLNRSASGGFTPVLRLAPEVDEAWAGTIAWCLERSPRRRPQDIATVRAAWEGLVDPPDWVRLDGDPQPTFDPADDSLTLVDTPRPDPSDTAIGTSFGRVAEAALVGARIEHTRIVTLRGFAGIGKTHLALLIAASRAGPGGVGAAVCDLTEARTEAGLWIALAVGLRIQLPGADPGERIGNVLAGRGNLLVVLDNAEQVREPLGRLLPELVRAAPRARFLVTSRKALGIRGESVVELGPLDPEAALGLFVERARQIRAGYRPSPEHLEHLRAIVARLEGIPLAIELAAARIADVPVPTLRAEIEAGSRRAPAMRVALEWSWNLLHPWEQHTLARCAGFHDGFTAESAEAIIDLSEWPGAPAVMEVLHGLVDHSLIFVRQDPSGTQRLHPYAAVRSFALERLEPEARTEARAAHAAHYARLGGREAMERRWGPSGFEAHRSGLGELQNLAAALDFAVEQGDPGTAAACAKALGWALARLGPPQAGLERVERVLAMPTLDPADRVLLLVQLARLVGETGAPERARVLLDQALQLAGRLQDPELEAEALTQLGALTHHSGDLQGALALFEGALELLDQAPVPRSRRIPTLRLLSSVLQHAGELARADRAVQEALELARTYQAVAELPNCLLQLGSLRAHQGRHEEASVAERRALAGSRRLGDRIQEGRVLANLGIRLHQLGQIEAAIGTFRKAAEIGRDTGGLKHESLALGNLAETLLEVGRLDEAEEALERAIALGDRSLGLLGGSFRVTLARVRIAQERLDEAAALLDLAEPLIRDRHRTSAAAHLLVTAELAARMADPAGARAALARADASIGADLGNEPELAALRDKVVRLLG